jgi:hypothetical protein
MIFSRALGISFRIGLLSLLGLGLHAQQLLPNPASAGLWVGDVTLSEVTYAAAGSPTQPVADSAQFRLLLHVGANGSVRLLKEVTLLRKTVSLPTAPTGPGPLTVPTSTPSPTATVMLLTDLSLLPGLTNVVRVDGKVRGQRLATAGYDLPDGLQSLPLAGGLGTNFRCAGTNVLAPNALTHPFRHAFHPDHTTAPQITRAFSLAVNNSLNQINGLDQLSGSYQETISGLHKAPLTARGTVTLVRISPVSVLNQ